MRSVNSRGMQSYSLDAAECKGILYKKLGNKRFDISLIKDSSQCKSTRSIDYKGNNKNREEAE
jgi:hypothetical protein